MISETASDWVRKNVNGLHNNQEENAWFDIRRKQPFRGPGTLKMGIYRGFVLWPKSWRLILYRICSSDTVRALQSILPF